MLLGAVDGGVSYILVHQTGLADTTIAENNDLLAVRTPRDTRFPTLLGADLQ